MNDEFDDRDFKSHAERLANVAADACEVIAEHFAGGSRHSLCLDYHIAKLQYLALRWRVLHGSNEHDLPNCMRPRG